MKLDILAFGAHPDDVELACSGTVAKHVAMGKKVGVIDLTEGELGSNGSVELRYKESAEASKILGLSIRENLRLGDCFFENRPMEQLEVVKMIRKYQPEIVFCNSKYDRHPDHGKGGDLVSRACFLSGLVKIETKLDGKAQNIWRPKAVYRYIQDRYIEPDFVVDITPYYETKIASIKAYSSQFYKENENSGLTTPISTKEFWDVISARMMDLGRPINAKYAEGFTVERTLGVNSVFDLI
jgi:bacillithiol biosynthesis deacetylase BshB1